MTSKKGNRVFTCGKGYVMGHMGHMGRQKCEKWPLPPHARARFSSVCFGLREGAKCTREEDGGQGRILVAHVAHVAQMCSTSIALCTGRVISRFLLGPHLGHMGHIWATWATSGPGRQRGHVGQIITILGRQTPNVAHVAQGALNDTESGRVYC